MDSDKKAYFPISIWANKSKSDNLCYRMIEAYSFEPIKQIYSSELSNEIYNNSSYNFSSNRYMGEIDSRRINDNTKAIVYRDKENELIGIVTSRPNIRLWWIPEAEVRKELHNESLINAGFSELVEIDSNFKYNYTSNSPLVHISPKVSFNFRNSISISEFKKIAGIIDNEPEVPEPTIDDIKQNLIDEMLKSDSNGLGVIVNEIVDRELNLDKLDMDLAYKEQELNKREKEIQLREYNMTKAELISDTENITDAEIIYDPMEIMTIKNDSVEKSTYDLVFKVLKKGDTVSVPFKVFNQFTLVAKSGALERNVDYTRFLQIMFIKLDKTQKVGLTAMVNVNNEDDVKVTVLEEYGNNTVTNSKLFEYENNYRQWKRDRSFIS